MRSRSLQYEKFRLRRNIRNSSCYKSFSSISDVFLYTDVTKLKNFQKRKQWEMLVTIFVLLSATMFCIPLTILLRSVAMLPPHSLSSLFVPHSSFVFTISSVRTSGPQDSHLHPYNDRRRPRHSSSV